MPGRTLPDWETRYLGVATRAEATDDGTLVGYPIVFHTLSVDLGGFRERILPSAVDRTLRDGLDVRAYFDHDTAKVLGRTTAGTLTLRKESRGLKATIYPPDTAMARDLMVSIRRGDISGMSFRFRVLDDEWRHEAGEPVREVNDMIVGEVSIVSEPAYPDTSVAVRSLTAYQSEHPLWRPSPDMLRRMLKAKS